MEQHTETARTYYQTIDDGEYGTLGEILAPGFIQERPDRTLSGPEEFVRFMREERPMTDTTHVVDEIYEDDGNKEVAARGRLRRENEDLFGFVDVFAFEDAKIARLWTYTR
jgi:ketosteroid isomerase-like protein